MITAQTVVRGRYFPADVMLPGRTMQWSRCYVIVTDTELCVWTRVDESPDWMSPLAGEPMLPITDRDGRNGFDVFTRAGLVVITVGSGCRCGALARWAGPSWGQTERARV